MGSTRPWLSLRAGVPGKAGVTAKGAEVSVRMPSLTPFAGLTFGQGLPDVGVLPDVFRFVLFDVLDEEAVDGVEEVATARGESRGFGQR